MHTVTGSQQNLEILATTYYHTGLIVNTKKTEVLSGLSSESAKSCQPFFILGYKINKVEQFAYLGSILTSSYDLSYKIQHPIK